MIYVVSPCHAADSKEDEKKEPTVEEIFASAEEEIKQHRKLEAFKLFFSIHVKTPDDPRAESALWRAAHLKKEVFLLDETADWEELRDIYRRFINYYPKSTDIPEAYLNLGIAYYKMNYFREALTYFKLFMKKLDLLSKGKMNLLKMVC